MSDLSKPQNIQDDVVVKLSYTLTVEDEVVDSTGDRQPIEFIQGHGQIIPGLEKELYGMTVGDQKNVTIAPEDAYGVYDEKAMVDFPRSEFPKNIPLQPGTPLQVTSQTGEVMDTRIHSVTDDTIRLDFNHPLAGKELNFDVIVVDLRAASGEELSHGHAHPDGTSHH